MGTRATGATAIGVVLSLSFLSAPRAEGRGLLRAADKLWLARAMVAEASWDNPTDHAAIAYVLFRRWQLHRDTYPAFNEMIRAYCRALRPRRARYDRQRWVRSLQFNSREPHQWPERATWSNYVARWDEIRQRVELFATGDLADPCPSAIHWGGEMDPSHGWVRVRCAGTTRNRFYRLP
jgi:hypothetical protein